MQQHPLFFQADQSAAAAAAAAASAASTPLLHSSPMPMPSSLPQDSPMLLPSQLSSLEAASSSLINHHHQPHHQLSMVAQQPHPSLSTTAFGHHYQHQQQQQQQQHLHQEQQPVDYSNDLAQLAYFLQMAPTNWPMDQNIRRFLLPTGEYISCVLHNNLFHVSGTDIVRTLLFRFQAVHRPVRNAKKFEEGVFSDLRNLKPPTDATLEPARSEFLEWLYKHNCVRTQKKQKVFYWFSVPWDQLFYDALDRDLQKEERGEETTSIALDSMGQKPNLLNMPGMQPLVPNAPALKPDRKKKAAAAAAAAIGMVNSSASAAVAAAAAVAARTGSYFTPALSTSAAANTSMIASAASTPVLMPHPVAAVSQGLSMPSLSLSQQQQQQYQSTSTPVGSPNVHAMIQSVNSRMSPAMAASPVPYPMPTGSLRLTQPVGRVGVETLTDSNFSSIMQQPLNLNLNYSALPQRTASPAPSSGSEITSLGLSHQAVAALARLPPRTRHSLTSLDQLQADMAQGYAMQQQQPQQQEAASPASSPFLSSSSAAPSPPPLHQRSISMKRTKSSLSSASSLFPTTTALSSASLLSSSPSSASASSSIGRREGNSSLYQLHRRSMPKDMVDLYASIADMTNVVTGNSPLLSAVTLGGSMTPTLAPTSTMDMPMLDSLSTASYIKATAAAQGPGSTNGGIHSPISSCPPSPVLMLGTGLTPSATSLSSDVMSTAAVSTATGLNSFTSSSFMHSNRTGSIPSALSLSMAATPSRAMSPPSHSLDGLVSPTGWSDLGLLRGGAL
ncbi:hypothetical protein RI367_001975 [Sorochytrium milnesiophthora]